ncbi:dihydrouridine synthase [Candidatus Falkowbacteria bacterium CG10_big_fil_rev_8_21_14_0_10_43_10]|uniref:tRNA-dihydrouridine synthase n=1 Tax=Candidatus Falkowbacteria bacterium CG10_big_fil_rev_8_21_14_0_10_43_10 TaxID=1974567 RepID=A0A2H0V1I1_9BACT|nr:MAG: dihydrouridine synthase [Candidatus Falkowbacteria bacterium CG10_big_fil_rev_8_21_14_0_10_43_10]
MLKKDMSNKNKINLGFWRKLSQRCRKEKRPIMCLAPMSDVTDEAFRQMFVKYGRPDVLWTEFVSVNGLCSEKGYENMLIDLKFKPNEHPIVAQVFGSDPKKFYQAAKIIKKLGFDGIDINMGCPDRKVEKQGAGAVLMKNYKLAQEIIAAAKRGSGKMPVSVKTRIGYNKIDTTKWIKSLLEAEPAVISIHWRTRKEMSDAPAHWSEAKKIMKLAKGTGTLIIGNGDVQNLEDAYKKIEEYGVDGIMVGRAAFGNPWFFNPRTSKNDVPLKKQLQVMAEHAVLFDKLFHGRKNFAVMKKHFKAYASGFKGAKELRAELMAVNSAREVKKIVIKYLPAGRQGSV